MNAAYKHTGERYQIEKIIITLLAILALTLVMGVALADGPTNPRWNEIREAEEWATGVHGQAYAQVSIECLREPTLTDPGQFRASVDRDPSGYEFAYIVHDEDHDHALVYHSLKTSSRTFNGIQLCHTGNYSVWVYLYNKRTGSIDSMAGYEFTVTEPEEASLDYQAAQIVQQCRGADDWETALNLHDYLTNHAYYDLNLEYYGPDIMVRGYGVCEGFSRAYMMLCEIAGIPVQKLESNIQNHTWNIIKLDGEWYQVDVTWDDPAVDNVPVSGWEGHEYFCLNDELMFMDHEQSDCVYDVPNSYDTPAYDHICDLLDAYYEIHMGLWPRYGEDGLVKDQSGDYLVVGIHYIRTDVLDLFIEKLNQGETDITIVWPYLFISDEAVYYEDEPDVYWLSEKEHVVFAWGLGHRFYRLNDGRTVAVEAYYTYRTDAVTLRVTGEVSPIDDPTLRVLRLPADLEIIESQAFTGLEETDAVMIPASVTVIAPDAFDQDILLLVP